MTPAHTGSTKQSEGFCFLSLEGKLMVVDMEGAEGAEVQGGFEQNIIFTCEMLSTFF